jgi:Ssp1 endopeptidase immunity protein Rap1a
MSLLKKFMLILLCTGLLNTNIVLAEEEEAEPELLTAGELLDNCDEGYAPGAPNQFCMRYVFGLVQTVLGLQQADQSAPIFCINPQVTRLEEATENVMAYLRAQSSRANDEAQMLVVEALNKNYPCSATGNQT